MSICPPRRRAQPTESLLVKTHFLLMQLRRKKMQKARADPLVASITSDLKTQLYQSKSVVERHHQSLPFQLWVSHLFSNVNKAPQGKPRIGCLWCHMGSSGRTGTKFPKDHA